MGTGVTAACNGQSVPCGSFAAPLYSENAADASVFTLNLAAGRGALLHCFCAVPEDSIVKEPLHKLPCNGSFYVYAPTSASPVLLCTSSSCPVRLESRAM